MNVLLEPKWEKFVKKMVRSGRYKSIGDVLREGLRLLDQRDQALKISFKSKAELEGMVEESVRGLEAGERIPSDVAIRMIREIVVKRSAQVAARVKTKKGADVPLPHP